MSEQIAVLRWYSKRSIKGMSRRFVPMQVANGELDEAIDGLMFEGLSFSVVFQPMNNTQQQLLLPCVNEESL